MSTLAPGTRLGNYEVLRILGDGGMATVYEARHLHLRSRHAIKVLNPDVLVHADIRDRFLEEGRIQANLKHPNIVAVTETIVAPGVAGLVMEYLDGATLDDYWRKERAKIGVGGLVQIFGQILDGVQAAHNQGIVHRDIKPTNIFIIKDPHGAPQAKLLDFGIAKLSAGAGKTRTGARMGTPPYMSPEQVRGSKDLTRQSDIWSLGVVLYELVAGDCPFQGADDFDLMEAIVKGVYRPVPPLVPFGVATAIEGALRVSVARRFAGCQQFRDALSRLPPPPPIPVVQPVLAPELSAPVAENSGYMRFISLGLVFFVIRVCSKDACLSQSTKAPNYTPPVAVPVPAPPAAPAVPPYAIPSPVRMIPISGGRVTLQDGGGSSQVAAFLLDETEVTVAAYAVCVRAGVCDTAGLNAPFFRNQPMASVAAFCSWGDLQRADEPVNCIDSNQAAKYCTFINKVLPTEQQWQQAAEGKNGNGYPWGSAPPGAQACWNGANNSVGKGARRGPCAVGAFPKGNTGQGVKDLAGNVFEWTRSCADRACAGLFVRGGSWADDDPRLLKTGARFQVSLVDRVPTVGFRCASAPPTKTTQVNPSWQSLPWQALTGSTEFEQGADTNELLGEVESDGDTVDEP